MKTFFSKPFIWSEGWRSWSWRKWNLICSGRSRARHFFCLPKSTYRNSIWWSFLVNVQTSTDIKTKSWSVKTSPKYQVWTVLFICRDANREAFRKYTTPFEKFIHCKNLGNIFPTPFLFHQGIFRQPKQFPLSSFNCTSFIRILQRRETEKVVRS